MAQSSSKFGFVTSLSPVVTLLFLGSILYSAYWYYMAENAESYVRTLRDDLRDYGIELDYDDFSVGGFPYRLELDFEDPVLSIEQGPATLTWRSPLAQAIVQPWKLNHAIIVMPSSQLLLENDDETLFQVRGENAQASVRVEEGRLRQISVAYGGNPAMQFGEETVMNAASAGFHLRIPSAAEKAAEQSDLNKPKLADLAVILKGLPVAKMIAPVPKTPRPGDAMKTYPSTDFEGYISIHGETMPQLSAQNLRRWSTNSGIANINGLVINTGDLTLSGDGSFALDQNLSLEGAISLKGRSASPALDLLESLKVLSAEQKSTMAKAAQNFKTEDGLEQLSIMMLSGTVNIGGQTIGRYGPFIK